MCCASGACRASVWLSRGVCRWLVTLVPVASESVISWTASVEPACGHPTVSLTTSAFYSSGLVPLRGSDLTVFSSRRSSCLVSLSLSRPSLSRNPAFLVQRALSGLPECMTQLEQQRSSFALIRLLVMTAKRQGSFRPPTIHSHAHSATHSSGHVSVVHQLAVSFQLERLI